SHYGHFQTGGSVQDGATDGFTVAPNGRVTITIAKSKVDNPTPGTLLAGINADCRTVAGTCPPTAAAFAPNDVTNSGQYVVGGHTQCSATPTLIAEFDAAPAGSGVDLSWTASASTTIRRWNAS